MRGLERTLAVPQAACFLKQRGCVHFQRSAGFELRNPGREQSVGIPDELVERFGGFPFHLQPAVQGLLETPCGIAQREETDHPAAALEGMKAAADGGERLAVGWISPGKFEMSSDAVENLVALFDEDIEQFRVDLGIARCEQVFGWRSLKRRSGGWRRDGFRRHRFHRFRFGVIVGEVVGGDRDPGRFGLGQGGRRFGDFDSLASDRQGLAGGGRIVDVCRRLIGIQQSVEVSLAALQFANEETQRRQMVGEVFVVVRLAFGCALGEDRNASRAVFHDFDGTALAEQVERTLDLLERGLQCR